ncbi:MAG: sigma-70 family RNA polymerase sigma factor [Planctomycetes bacterium]|nr:sigma-70 family RNA polymerase sigma factor [Planctomycetota bacterium]
MGGARAAFPETVWSTVLRAKDDGAALGRLIERSWKPLYFYLRRKGRDVEAAKDLTQAFFSHLLERRLMDRVEQGRGRFRGFLLASMEHFLANEYRVATAEKRGGTSAPLSLDFQEAETQYAPALAETAESLYTRAWAISVLQGALADLGAELGGRFEPIRAHLSAGEHRPTYRESAAKLGLSEFEFTNLLHKARVRLGELIVARVRDTVDGDPGEEVSELLRALGRKS